MSDLVGNPNCWFSHAQTLFDRRVCHYTNHFVKYKNLLFVCKNLLRADRACTNPVSHTLVEYVQPRSLVPKKGLYHFFRPDENAKQFKYFLMKRFTVIAFDDVSFNYLTPF